MTTTTTKDADEDDDDNGHNDNVDDDGDVDDGAEIMIVPSSIADDSATQHPVSQQPPFGDHLSWQTN